MLSIRIEATSSVRETVYSFPGLSWMATKDTSTARSEAPPLITGKRTMEGSIEASARLIPC